MASRAWASAEAVTVQVFTTMMSAVAEGGAEVQPRSSNRRSRAAPSACVARQPNCWMKKLGIGNRGIEPKKNNLHRVRRVHRVHREEKTRSFTQHEPMQGRSPSQWAAVQG